MLISFRRCFSTTTTQLGKKNFRKFLLYGKRGTRIQKLNAKYNPDPEMKKLSDRGVRPVGFQVGRRFEIIPEMIPEIIVPDLKDCKLKPYVSYQTPDVIQGEFRPQDLFYAVYGEKIKADFKDGKLNEDGSAKEPSSEEQLTPEEARKQATALGSDMF